MTNDLRVDVGRSQLGLGVIAGVAAYVVGFLASFLPGPIANPRAYPPNDVVNASIDPRRVGVENSQFPLSETIDAVSSAGGLFYNAHFVDVITPRGPGSPSFRSNVLLAEHTNATTGFGGITGGEVEITLVGLPIPPVLFFAVPVLLLGVGGYMINERSGRGAPTPETAVLSGSAVALGYLPLVAVGAAMIRFRNPQILFGKIDFVGAISIAGIVYPVVFGGIGGYVWFATRNSEDTDREESTMEDRDATRRSREGSPGDRRAAGTPESPGDFRSVERVTMSDDLAFEPDTVTITPGDVVRWENEGRLTFTVTAYRETIPRGVEYFASGGFDSEETAREAYPEGGIASGESYEHVFNTPGTYEYFCVPQEGAGMTGTVEVRER